MNFERRPPLKHTYHPYELQVVAEKVEYALSQGLKVCLCVGESLRERECNETAQVVSRQVQAVAGKFH
jgi:triosephosphate isomerase